MLLRTIIAAASLTIAVPCAAQSAEVRVDGGTRLDVVATGQVTRVPDVVLIEAGVSTLAPTATEAIRGNSARMDAMRSALRSAGLTDRDLQTSDVSLGAEHRQERDGSQRFLGYRANHRLSVRFRDAANAGRILDTLVTAGATSIHGPSFEISEAAAAFDEARLSALAAARARAELYARSLGMRVARVVEMSESESSGPLRDFAGPSASNVASMMNIDLGEEAVGVTLRVTFELR